MKIQGKSIKPASPVNYAITLPVDAATIKIAGPAFLTVWICVKLTLRPLGGYPPLVPIGWSHQGKIYPTGTI